MTTDAFNQAFAVFARDKLRPAIDGIPARKRASLLAAALAGGAVFVVLAGATYFLLRPYYQLMREHNIVSFWPLILLAPAALAMIAFALVHILNLRSVVKEFQSTLILRMTEFIDPGLAHEAHSPVEAGTLEDSLLFAGLGKPAAGADRFRGRSGGAAVELRDLHVRTAAPGKEETLAGVFMKATMDRAFREPLFVFPRAAEASRSGLERGLADRGVAVAGGLVRLDDATTARQVLRPSAAGRWGDGFLPRGVGDALADLRREDGTELYLGCRDRMLYLALLSRSETPEAADAPDAFDFGHCREFCRKGGAAMQLARELSEHPDIWRE